VPIPEGFSNLHWKRETLEELLELIKVCKYQERPRHARGGPRRERDRKCAPLFIFVGPIFALECLQTQEEIVLGR